MTTNPLRATDSAQKTELLGRLLELWIAHPHMRLGQLIENVFPCGHDVLGKDGLMEPSDDIRCFYYKEDYALVEELELAYRKLAK